MIARVLIWFLIFLTTGGCLSPLDVGPIPFKPQLVVSGLLTNEMGEHSIELSMSSSTNDPESNDRVSGASVRLYDDLGRTWTYSETKPGRYVISDIGAEPGRSYYVEINMDDTVTYRSKPQTMPEPGEITELYYEVGSRLEGAAGSAKQYSFKVLLDAHSDSDDNFLRWRTSGTFEFITHPELNTGAGTSGAKIPMPHACSGYVVGSDGGLMQVAPCTCCQCWVTEYSSSVIISDTQVAQRGTFHGVQVATIPVDRFRFFNKYRLEVEQMSLSEDVFRFWQRVKTQEESGSIFQTNITKVSGNIFNVNDPTDVVFGVFAVSSIVRKDIIFRRSDAPERLQSLLDITAPCYDYDFIIGATTVKPDFW